MPKAKKVTQASPEQQPKAVAGPESISPLIIISPIVLSIVMSGLLGFFYGLTKEPIAASKKLEEQTKLQAVMPAFDNDPLASMQNVSDSVTIYSGEQGGVTSGYGIKSAVETGYAGHFSIMFGVNPDGSVNKVQILETAETPGLGSKAAQPFFIDQFAGKRPGEFTFKVTKDGGNVDAITGATITSRAVCDCINNGLEALKQIAPADASSASPTAAAATAPASEQPLADPAASAVVDPNAPVTSDPAAGAATPPADGSPAEPAPEDPNNPGTEPAPSEEPAGEQ
jgi:Na+-translocating ferredoxin:NAD+ oxidoreductase subunit G